MNDQEAPFPAEAHLLARDVTGQMVGHGNRQYIVSRQGLADVEKFSSLAVRARADFLEKKAGQDLDDVAFILYHVDVHSGGQVISAIWRRNPDLAISVLMHVERERAEALIAAMGSAAADLTGLPEAAESIADCERPTELDGRGGRLHLAAKSQRDTRGFYQNFENGQIHWSAERGAHATVGMISRYHIDGGGSGGRLGFPVSPQMDAVRSERFDTSGLCQRFEFVRDYSPELWEQLGGRCGATVYWSEKHGAHAVWGGIGSYYERQEGTAGQLGFPAGEETPVTGPRRNDGSRTTGWLQRFEGGVLYWTEKTKGALFVPDDVARHHASHGGAEGSLGFPVSPVLRATQSPSGTAGRFQRFEAKKDYDKELLEMWSDQEGPAGATIYISESHGAHCVGWGIGHVYEQLGGTGSWLGFPTSGAVDTRDSETEPKSSVQQFEGGAIFYREGHGSVPVPLRTLSLFAGQTELVQRLGFPIAEERPLDPEGQERAQFFESGLVTVREGRAEAWVRPPAGYRQLAAVGVRQGHLEIWALSQDGKVSHSWWPDDKGRACWNGPYNFPVPSGITDIAVASSDPSHITVFVLDDQGNLWRKSWEKEEGWSDEWEKFGGSASAPLTACSREDGHFEIFAQDAQGQSVIHSWKYGSADWHSWVPLDMGLDVPTD